MSAPSAHALLLASATSFSRQTRAPTPIARSELCVTEGQLEARDGALRIEGPKLRAYALVPVADAVEARFTYLGATAQVSPLASGAMRHLPDTDSLGQSPLATSRASGRSSGSCSFQSESRSWRSPGG